MHLNQSSRTVSTLVAGRDFPCNPAQRAEALPGSASCRYHWAPVPQIRNPKPEVRKKSEFRSPKHLSLWPSTSPPTQGRVRFSGFGLPSDFGLRVSDFAPLTPVALTRCARCLADGCVARAGFYRRTWLRQSRRTPSRTSRRVCGKTLVCASLPPRAAGCRRSGAPRHR